MQDLYNPDSTQEKCPRPCEVIRLSTRQLELLDRTDPHRSDLKDLDRQVRDSVIYPGCARVYPANGIVYRRLSPVGLQLFSKSVVW